MSGSPGRGLSGLDDTALGTVKAFVKAVVRALVYVNANRDEMLAFAKTEFPPATEGDLEA